MSITVSPRDVGRSVLYNNGSEVEIGVITEVRLSTDRVLVLVKFDGDLHAKTVLGWQLDWA